MTCALLLAGCSALTPTLVDPVAAPPASPLSIGDYENTTASSDAAGAVASGSGSELRVANIGAVVTDPLRVSVVRPTDMIAVDLLYDGLTAWDQDAATWRLSLASSMLASADGLTWTVTMAPATFSDGSAITAGDIARSLNRARTADGTSAATRLEMVAGITATEDNLVEIKLTSRFALLPELLSSPVFGIVPDGLAHGSVTSGPIVRQAAELFVPRDGRAAVDVRFVPVINESEAAELEAQGALDLAFVSSRFDGPVDETQASLVEAHYAFTIRSPALSDVANQQAVIEAVGRSALSHTGFNGAALVIDRLVPAALACMGERVRRCPMSGSSHCVRG